MFTSNWGENMISVTMAWLLVADGLVLKMTEPLTSCYFYTWRSCELTPNGVKNNKKNVCVGRNVVDLRGQT